MTSDFDICGPLPTGTTVLEASAGTGKTFTIAALATRYVAEGRAELSELMLVTFGRMATQELRERVRQRLVSAEQGLAEPARARDGIDDLLRLLATAPDDEVALRRQRLATALADFDAATLTTTHGFCLQMLRGLGVAGDLDPDATFVESVDDLAVDVTGDLYLRKFGRPDSPEPTMTYVEALDVVRAAVEDRQAALAPEGAESATTAGQRHGIAVAARREVEVRKRRARLLDYDDLLTRLRDALADDVRGPAARGRLRARYRVVLVDEFQDTDPVQWQILSLAFHGHTTLVLIGDPKQAIYAFRGGDVIAYLDATRRATTAATLGRNWRSDSPLLAGLAVVFGQAALGDPGIVVRPVDAQHVTRRLLGAPAAAPLRLRVVRRDDTHTSPSKTPLVGPTRAVIAADLAGDVARLLSSGAQLCLDGRNRLLAPGDVAVLTHTNKQATLVRDALQAVGVPAVVTGMSDVFSTAVAAEWLVLLQALVQPRGARVRTAALTCFVGWTATRLAEEGDDALDVLSPQLRGWADVLRLRGVPTLLETMTEGGRLVERLLSTEAGERTLTDLRHVAQALHAAATQSQLGPAALVEWLGHRIHDARSDATEERLRRLESDADAVQVVTVHRSKGLEFPIAYVPYGWDRFKPSTPDLLRLHVDGRRTLDVGGPSGLHYEQHRGVHRAEEAGEDLRLLYVALTRAQCQVVTWWAPSTNTTASATHRLLFGAHQPGEQPPDSVPLPTDALADTRFAELSAAAGAALAVEPVDPQPAARWRPSRDAPPALAAARFDRQLDTAWRRLSYSALTAGTHEARAAGPAAGGDPDEHPGDDERTLGPPVDASGEADSALQVASPMADLPSGTAFGIVVHDLLEHADTSAPDLEAELIGRAHDVLAGRPASGLDPEALGRALVPAMQTPLGPVAGASSLRDIPPGDRLAELAFELPLAGGDHPTGTEATMRTVAGLLRDRLPPDDPLAAYPDLLADLPQHRLRGYLTGSLDSVLRLSADGRPRYLVADYKTNWLGESWPGSGEPLTAWHYRPDALRAAMLEAHYPLQALLYLVALHRYLIWRQPGYDPDVHLGGALYLFVRGMCGPSTPTVDGAPCGVFGWQPPPGLVPALSGLLAGGAA